MTQYTKLHAPCPWCSSSDAYCEFKGEKGLVGHCHACGKSEVLDGERKMDSNKKKRDLVETQPIDKPYRNISVKTLKKFRTGSIHDENYGVGLVYYYGDNSQKFRFKKPSNGKKFFEWVNYQKDGLTLYGAHIFGSGAKRITITEGENDAMAVYDMMGDYPVVSIRNGASAAKRMTDEDFKYLNSFNEIIVCFDNDAPGKEAVEAFCAVFPSKTKVVDFPAEYKDAHQMLEEGAKDKFRERWWNAKPWSPSNIVYPIDILDDIIDPPKFEVVPFPWEGLNHQIFGMHTPELLTLSAQPKIGKSLITAALVHHVHETTDELIADITVENTPSERNRTLLSLKVGKPLHLMLANQDIGVDKQELKKEAKLYFEDRRIISFERDGITNVDQIFDKINYLVEVVGVRFIMFDHINYAASYHENDERKALDAVANRMADLAKDKRVFLAVVSHENDDGRLFGSRNLLKASHTVIKLERDKEHQSSVVRNITKLTVTESRRYGSRIGLPIYLKYNEDNFGFTELPQEFAESLINESEIEKDSD